MADFGLHSLPADLAVVSVVDDPLFTDVTEGGEVYRTFRIVRFVYEFDCHPQGWTHLAVALAERNSHEVEAFLRVENRVVEESYVSVESD